MKRESELAFFHRGQYFDFLANTIDRGLTYFHFNGRIYQNLCNEALYHAFAKGCIVNDDRRDLSDEAKSGLQNLPAEGKALWQFGRSLNAEMVTVDHVDAKTQKKTAVTGLLADAPFDPNIQPPIKVKEKDGNISFMFHPNPQDKNGNDIITVKERIMLDLCFSYATQNPAVLLALLSTGDRPLVEDSASAKDDKLKNPFWGNAHFNRNALGKIWMQVRQQLRQELDATGKVKIRLGFSEEVCQRMGFDFDPKHAPRQNLDDEKNTPVSDMQAEYSQAALDAFAASTDYKMFIASPKAENLPKRALNQLIAIENKLTQAPLPPDSVTLNLTEEKLDSDMWQYVVSRFGKGNMYPKHPEVAEKDKDTSITVEDKDFLAVAAEQARAGKETCVVNFGHAKKPGGDYDKGNVGREAMLCLRSDLGAQLQAAEHHYEGDGLTQAQVLFTPSVTVNRLGPEHGFARLPENQQYQVSVMTASAVAAKNANAIAANKANIHLQLKALAMLQIRHFVHGAFGCGRQGNDPQWMASEFYKALTSPEFNDAFDSKVFAILAQDVDYDPYAEFRRVFEGKVLKDAPPAYGEKEAVVANPTSSSANNNAPLRQRGGIENYESLAKVSADAVFLQSLLSMRAGKPVIGCLYHGRNRDMMKFYFANAEDRDTARHFIATVQGIEEKRLWPEAMAVEAEKPLQALFEASNNVEISQANFPVAFTMSPDNLENVARFRGLFRKLGNYNIEMKSGVMNAYGDLVARIRDLQANNVVTSMLSSISGSDKKHAALDTIRTTIENDSEHELKTCWEAVTGTKDYKLVQNEPCIRQLQRAIEACEVKEKLAPQNQ